MKCADIAFRRINLEYQLLREAIFTELQFTRESWCFLRKRGRLPSSAYYDSRKYLNNSKNKGKYVNCESTLIIAN